jgi:hypothetical protein
MNRRDLQAPTLRSYPSTGRLVPIGRAGFHPAGLTRTGSPHHLVGRNGQPASIPKCASRGRWDQIADDGRQRPVAFRRPSATRSAMSRGQSVPTRGGCSLSAFPPPLGGICRCEGGSAHSFARLGGPTSEDQASNVVLVQQLPGDDHNQEGGEPPDDQSDEVSPPERLLLVPDRHDRAPSGPVSCWADTRTRGQCERPLARAPHPGGMNLPVDRGFEPLARGSQKARATALAVRITPTFATAPGGRSPQDGAISYHRDEADEPAQAP